MAASTDSQNVTIRLARKTVRRARVLAAQRNTSISRLLAEHVEHLVGEADAYEKARRQAAALLDQGFRLGGRIRVTRDQWHER